MKTNEEFLAQVYEKYTQEQRQRAQRKKRMRTAATTVAVCMVLLIGVMGTDGFTALRDHMIGEDAMNSVDSAAPDNAAPDDAVSGDAMPGDADGIAGYYLLPRVTISSSTAVQDSAAESDASLQVVPGREGVEAVEKILAALRDEDRVIAAGEEIEDWQATYRYQVEIEETPQQVEFYYIIGEVDWHEALG